MLDKIYEIFKWFFSKEHFLPWIENHLFYFFLVGLALAFILIVILLVKTRRDIIKLNKSKRKRDKQILKFLSDKKNKTF